MARWGVSFANACRMRLCEGVLRCATHPDALNDRPTACARVREASFWLHDYRADKTERMPDTRGHILDAATDLSHLSTGVREGARQLAENGKCSASNGRLESCGSWLFADWQRLRLRNLRDH